MDKSKNKSKDYEKKLDEIRAIPVDRIKRLKNIPVAVYIQEADNLYHWCRADKDALTARGLDWDLVMDLPLRIEALIKTEAAWNEERISGHETAQEWAGESRAAYALQKKLLHEFRFAFKQDGKTSSIVDEIAQKKGHAGLIQSLNDLAVLGRAYPQLFPPSWFDSSLLDKAAEAADKLSPLLADVTRYGLVEKETKRTRDQAYTHLKEAVDQVYRLGLHVFPRSSERRKGYRSEYLHRKRIRRPSPPKKSK